jgi:Saxitoxin biosynthesis operon protein SxtJ
MDDHRRDNGWVNSRIILSVVYYILIVPIGVIQRMTGKDAMRRKFEPTAETYKIPRARRPASHMQRQY